MRLHLDAPQALVALLALNVAFARSPIQEHAGKLDVWGPTSRTDEDAAASQPRAAPQITAAIQAMPVGGGELLL